MKPVDLVAYCLANSTSRGGSVLDPFAGSGSTIIAAEQLDRRCYATEIDPRYVVVSISRCQQFTGRTAEQIDG
jgi:DNA modification methylase